MSVEVRKNFSPPTARAGIEDELEIRSPPQGDVMQEERLATGIPAAERAIAGLCHDINNRLASLHAYLFVLERRGLSAEESAVPAAEVCLLRRTVAPATCPEFHTADRNTRRSA